MKIIVPALMLSVLLMSAPAADAGLLNGFGVGIKGSSLGLGAEVSKSITHKLNVRGSFHSFTYALDGEMTEQDVEYTADLNLASWSAVLDWHPMGNSFYFSGGVVGNGNEIEGTIVPLTPRTVGSRTYSVDEQGSLTTNITWPSTAPYFGIGFGNPTMRGMGMFLDIGVMLQGAPLVEMTGDGMISPSVRNAPQLEEDLSGATTWLVVSLGFTYGIF